MSKIKKVKSRFIRKLRSAFHISNSIVEKNQLMILEALDSEKTIFLNPINLRGCGGNVEHYYHFIFDLVLPLFFSTQKSNPDITICLNHFGILSDFLLKIFGEKIKLLPIDSEKKKMRQLDLIGMNPLCIQIPHGQMDDFKTFILSSLEIRNNPIPKKIILIERMPPKPYYLKEAISKGSGSSRRSVSNREEFCKTIKSMVKPPYEFHNLQLENIPFKEQIKYFSDAALVIGQHGAGLSNVVWMNSKSIVIELGYKSMPHFKILSSIKQHYYLSRDFNKTHINIDCKKFVIWISKQKILKPYFN